MSKAVFSAGFESARKEIVEDQIKHRGIRGCGCFTGPATQCGYFAGSPKGTPPHLFVEPRFLSLAYSDFAFPIKENQTISQPYIVAVKEISHTASTALTAKRT